MKKNIKLILAFVAVGLLAGVGAGAAVWWSMPSKPGTPVVNAGAAKPAVDTRVYKYLNLEKVVVMLRRSPGESMTHYMSTDLVIKVAEDKEKLVKEHLPLLRSIAVKALSSFPMDKAEIMTVDQFAAEINRAFADNYAKERREKPFSEVMIGKLIIE
ncbi:flagellar basal body-associated FliL family protein [Undibacterium sp.]|jgi:flagellar FliL protein|uniref:flagellar basal body-associated FliL family protein n=1 Tax=Undibacterium sp. TaxID=1914977 RepID=UPI002BE085D1|nr:flagellar basal body-associated FliL family protein [Undibacterium sp.]HTD04162.1 flagellar basal body-associated FliL family protein [Undibacterium sp.]